jgi:hypothetical protein
VVAAAARGIKYRPSTRSIGRRLTTDCVDYAPR